MDSGKARIFMEETNLVDVVRNVRRNFEKRTIDYVLLYELYQEYNPRPDNAEFISISKKYFPRYNCGLASVYLQHLLGSKIVQRSYQQYQHTVLLQGKIIIDITADQFDGPKMYVGALKRPWCIGNYRVIPR